MRVRVLSGKGRRINRTRMAHKPSGRGIGKWQNRRSLWAYKLKSRICRKIADASRRRNRGL